MERHITLAVSIAVLSLLAGYGEAATHDRVARVPGLTGIIESASEEFGVNANLIQAVIEVESMYRAKAVSKVGARGLMQVKPSTAEWIAGKMRLPYGGAETLFEPETSVRIGTAYLAYLTNKFGDVGHAVMAYNLGPTALTVRLRNEEELPDTYIGKVTSVYLDILNWKGE
jgi:soluble lytic murein transglycosylase